MKQPTTTEEPVSERERIAFAAILPELERLRLLMLASRGILPPVCQNAEDGHDAKYHLRPGEH